MFCPQCRAEYRDGLVRCAECDVDLVAELAPEDHEPVKYVTVYQTTEPDVIPVIKSLLESEDIPYLIEGEGLSNLFPGVMGGFYDPAAAQVRFEVPVDYAEAARKLFEARPEVPDGQDPEPAA